MAKKRSKELYLGVDVGGTKILAGLVDGAGRVIARKRAATPREGDADETVAAILAAMEKALDKGGVVPESLAGIGVAVPGQIRPGEGLIVNTPNMNLSGVNLGKRISDHFKVPCELGNDVRMGTLGEKWLGAARAADSAVGIFIGTGIGGGIISGGILSLGARGVAGEIGHIIMDPDGPQCGCGNRGCFEALASRTAIERDIRAAVAAGRHSLVTALAEGDDGLIRGKVLSDALEQEDEVVTEVMRRAARLYGLACLSVRHLIDPDVIVLGGGVMEACGWFVMPIVREIVEGDPLPGVREGGFVVQATLGDDATLLGTVALAKGYGRERPVKPSEPPLPDYPKIKYVGWGEVAVGKDVHSNDIYIRGDGKVRKRKKELAKAAYGTSHRLGPQELEKICKGRPETLIIGTGQNGMLALDGEGQRWLDVRGIAHHSWPSPRAAKAYNKTRGRKAAVIHVTC